MARDPHTALRVLHLNFHRGWGGQPQRILIESVRLAARGHAVALAVPGDGILAARGREAGLTVFGDFAFRPPARAVSFLRDVREARRIIDEWRPDILHSHGSQDTWVTVAANRWFGGPRLPHVLTRHNTKRIADSAANRYLYGRAIDRLVVVSRSVLERFAPFIERGLIDPGEVPVIHSSIDIGRFTGPADPRGVPAGIGVPAEAPLIGCVGRLVPDKGQTYLLDAFELLRARHADAHLLLAGVGTDEERLRRRVSERGLSEKVHFLGFREDVPDIMAALRVLVLPSVDCDASSAVIKEAMAVGTPVVATDIGGASEILSPGPSGVVVPPADAGALAEAIDRLLSDPVLARSLGEAGPREVRERFDPELLCDAYLEVYRGLSAPGSRGLSAGS